MAPRAVVMGLGSFGGGAGAVRHLVARGFDVLISDARPQAQLESSLAAFSAEIAGGRVTLGLGGHDAQHVINAELLVVNPAIKAPWDNALIRAAAAGGARVTTEIALALDALPEPLRLIGVTGSAGKSTTAAMIHAGMAAGGRRSHLGGNIGGSLLDHLDSIRPGDAVVMELSSAMLWWLDQPGAMQTPRWPAVAVVTGFSPNHLDWHGSAEHYRQSKQVLLRRLAAGGRAVLSGEAAAWPLPYGVERLAPVDDGQLPFLRVPGTHNRRNAAAALSACRAAGVPVETASAGLAAFPGLPHRLQLVREHRGVRWYNDSKSTVPEATLLALDALAPAPVHLIVGGSDKGIDLAPLAELAPRVRSLLCIGQTGERIAAMAGVPPVGTLDAAVARAAREVKPGQAVLLSPGCASFDQFRSFEHRGDRFAELVGALA